MGSLGRTRVTGSAFAELTRLIVVVAFTAVGDRVGKYLVADPASGKLVLGAILGAAIGYVVGGAMGRSIERSVGGLEGKVRDISGADVVAGGIGMLGGLLAASLV